MKSEWDEESASSAKSRSSSRWDTPASSSSKAGSDTPSINASRKNRWDETPAKVDLGATPQRPSSSGWDSKTAQSGMTTPGGHTRWDEAPNAVPGFSTPSGNTGAQTPSPGQLASMMTPEQLMTARWDKDIDDRNRSLTDDVRFPKYLLANI